MHQLASFPVHLGPRGKAISEPAFDGIDWYAAYADRHSGDGSDGWLVTQFSFAENWRQWEIHPEGSEVVLCIAGQLTLIQERSDEDFARITLNAGDYAINPAGVWHTADVPKGGSATCLFITPGIDTSHRPR